MKRLILVLAMFAAATVMAQDKLHVTSVHTASNATEKTYRTSLNQMIYEGAIGNKVYTLEVIKGFGIPKLEVGTDYDVVQVKGETVKIMVPGKRKPESLSLNVVTVAEKN